MQEPVPGIQAMPDESNARYFHVIVAGPAEVWCETKSKEFQVFDFLKCDSSVKFSRKSALVEGYLKGNSSVS